MKKHIIFASIIAISLLFVGVKEVNAKSCSGILQAPQLPQGYAENRGHLVNLRTAASACKGSNTEVWFSNFGTLPSWYTPGAGTIVHGELWEEDPPGNADERVKYYIGSFTGRVLTNFWLQQTYITGNIDSEGDQSCELYMMYSISGITGQQPIPAGLFNYQICMN